MPINWGRRLLYLSSFYLLISSSNVWADSPPKAPLNDLEGQLMELARSMSLSPVQVDKWYAEHEGTFEPGETIHKYEYPGKGELGALARNFPETRPLIWKLVRESTRYFHQYCTQQRTTEDSGECSRMGPLTTLGLERLLSELFYPGSEIGAVLPSDDDFGALATYAEDLGPTSTREDSERNVVKDRIAHIRTLMHDAAAYRVLRNYIDETNVPLNAPLAYFNWIQGGLERLEGMWINEQWSAGRKLLAPESYNSQRYNDGFDSVTLELWPNVDKLIKLAMLDLRGKNPEWAHCLNDSYTQVPELEFTQAQIQRLLSIHDQLLRRYEPKNPSPYNEFGTWCGSLAGVFLDKAKDRAKVIQAIHAMGSKASKPMKAFAQYLTHRGE